MYCGSPLEYGISLEEDGVFQDEAIQYGIGGFDDMGQAMIAVIQILTVEDWSTIMYNVRIIQITNRFKMGTIQTSLSSTSASQ